VAVEVSIDRSDRSSIQHHSYQIDLDKSNHTITNHNHNDNIGDDNDNSVNLNKDKRSLEEQKIDSLRN